MSNTQNLKPWKPGQSGNPAGKPKGTKHFSTWIQEMMEDDQFTRKLANGRTKKEMPVKAIVSTLITKALDGDMRAIDLLAKYGYGTKIDLTSKDQPLSFSLGDAGRRFVKHVSEEPPFDPAVDRLDELPGRANNPASDHLDN